MLYCYCTKVLWQSNRLKKKQIWLVVMVNSYNTKHPAGEPQLHCKTLFKKQTSNNNKKKETPPIYLYIFSQFVEVSWSRKWFIRADFFWQFPEKFDFLVSPVWRGYPYTMARGTFFRLYHSAVPIVTYSSLTGSPAGAFQSY